MNTQGEHEEIRDYCTTLIKYPLLTKEQEIELAARVKQGDLDARQTMINSNLRLVVKIAYDFKNRGLPLNDLIQEGNVGLITAVERFDPEKGGKLSTYAAWWIKQGMLRAIAHHTRVIRIPTHVKEKIDKINKVKIELKRQLHRDPEDYEVAEYMGIPEYKLNLYKNIESGAVSLDDPITFDKSSDSMERVELVPDNNAEIPSQVASESDQFNLVHNALKELDERTQTILSMRFGLNGYKKTTLEECGKVFNITRERVRQLERAGILNLRKKLMKLFRQKSSSDIAFEKLLKELHKNSVRNQCLFD